MSDHDETVARYLALWNEPDAAARRAGIARLFTEDAGYTDPLADVAGHEAIDALIAGAQAQFPGLTFRQVGAADAHQDILRFTWGLGPDGVAPADAPVIGFDVAVLGADGRIRQVLGFLDRVPSA